MFELTYDCNFRCKHCYVPPAYQRKYRKLQLKTRQVFEVIDQLKDCGCLYLGFTGGEPLVRPDILAILNYAKKQGFQVILYSNGSKFNQRVVSQLADISPNKIDITIPGMSKHVFESITNVSGSWEAVFKGIKLLRDKKVDLGFKTCLLKENSREINKIKSFSRSLNIQHRLDTLLCARLDGSPEPYKFRGRLLGARRRKEYSKAAVLKQSCAAKGLRSSFLFFCGAGISQAAITPAGELKLCAMIDQPKYNILDLGFEKAWENLQGVVCGSRPDKTYRCLSCDLRAYCVWCPARSWLYNKSFCACDPRLRLWAQKVKEDYAR